MPIVKERLVPLLSSEQSSGQITKQLQRWGRGEENALDDLVPLVYPLLKRIAARLMRNERRNHTLQPTALVNEAFFKLKKTRHLPWQNRKHFLAIAARAMRQVLVEYARKRRPKFVELPTDTTLPEPPAGSLGVEDLLILNIALDRLASCDVRKARVVELRFFGGLTNEEIAEVLKISPNTVIKDMRFAEAWLRREMAAIKSNDTSKIEDD